MFSAAGYRHCPLTDALSGELLLPFCYQAERGATRRKGLLGLNELPDGHGLLLGEAFVHMVGMRFPLDLVLIDRAGAIIRVLPNVGPGWRLRGSWRARYILELAAGGAEKAGLESGRRVRFS